MDLRCKALELRASVVDMIYRARAGHIGGDMSVMDILTALYYDQMNISPDTTGDPMRDRFILSKGHSVEALYAILADRGFIDPEALNEYFTFQSELLGHPNNHINGIEMNSGALGHGLSVCVGMAIAGKMQNRPYRVYTVMGDGELAEGSVWEAAECAAKYKLDNLCAVVDWNGLQISGTVEQVMSHGNLRDRFAVYGWHVLETDGHDLDALHSAFEQAKTLSGKPTAIIAKTVKGKGISFMEGRYQWHHKVLTDEEYTLAKQELEAHRKECAL